MFECSRRVEFFCSIELNAFASLFYFKFLSSTLELHFIHDWCYTNKIWLDFIAKQNATEVSLLTLRTWLNQTAAYKWTLVWFGGSSRSSTGVPMTARRQKVNKVLHRESREWNSEQGRGDTCQLARTETKVYLWRLKRWQIYFCTIHTPVSHI